MLDRSSAHLILQFSHCARDTKGTVFAFLLHQTVLEMLNTNDNFYQHILVPYNEDEEPILESLFEDVDFMDLNFPLNTQTTTL